MGHKTESLEIKVHLNSSLKINCDSMETISLTKLTSKRVEAKNVTKFYVEHCMATPIVEILETLKMANNETSKSFYLNDIANLEAEHLTGLDEFGVKVLSVDIVRDLKPKLNLFSTIPKLEELLIKIPFENYSPDLSKLPRLTSLSVYIATPEEKIGCKCMRLWKS